eukprot:4889545-Pyramimonas_sp.AAC.1
MRFQAGAAAARRERMASRSAAVNTPHSGTATHLAGCRDSVARVLAASKGGTKAAHWCKLVVIEPTSSAQTPRSLELDGSR